MEERQNIVLLDSESGDISFIAVTSSQYALLNWLQSRGWIDSDVIIKKLSDHPATI